jgi:hypothetical protein
VAAAPSPTGNERIDGHVLAPAVDPLGEELVADHDAVGERRRRGERHSRGRDEMP